MLYEMQPSGGALSWATFSTRNLGLRINRRMAEHFEGDSGKLRASSLASSTRSLRINPSRWTALQQQSLENWSLVLALIPDLALWSPSEKHQLIEIIRSKSSSNEMRYLRQTQQHPRLRSELLRLGSKP